MFLGASLHVGSVAPDFTATDTDGQMRTLSEMVKKGPVVLAFFPKAFTSGCTREMQAYRDRIAELTSTGAQVLAVSTDDLETQRRFKTELGAPFPFLADPEARIVELYGVKTPIVTYAKRRTFVIGRDQRVLALQEGGDAIDPTAAIGACSAKPSTQPPASP